MCENDTNNVKSDNTWTVNVRINPHIAPCGVGQDAPVEVGQSTTLAARFWSKVEIKSDSECWLWTACADNAGDRGYGLFYRATRERVRAHRFSYELAYGPVPDGMQVCHRCDVRRCVNPAHLFVGTVSDNALDAYRKGRRINPHRWVKRYPGVSADTIRLIRRTKFQSTTSLALELGLDTELVSCIRNGVPVERLSA